MIRFIRAASELGAKQLRNTLIAELSEQRQVLWLVSGGSNIPISVTVMEQLPARLTRRLIVMPMDERYGEVGHKDSNYFQLKNAGFNHKRATLVPILQGGSLAAATAALEDQARRLFDQSEVIIGQFGIGNDGHTAGILPRSIASEATSDFAVSYQGPDFTRITLTFEALRRATSGFAFAYGPEKRSALNRLMKPGEPLAALPAGILHAIPDAYVYNDQLAEEGVHT